MRCSPVSKNGQRKTTTSDGKEVWDLVTDCILFVTYLYAIKKKR